MPKFGAALATLTLLPLVGRRQEVGGGSTFQDIRDE
jgi:hypothetical protein